jgi:hypothetical protein
VASTWCAPCSSGSIPVQKLARDGTVVPAGAQQVDRNEDQIEVGRLFGFIAAAGGPGEREQ